MTGKSANKWIDESLIVEAKILLKTPDITVQRVADLLNFSDQSTFGKFFKKHVGLSPMELGNPDSMFSWSKIRQSIWI